MGSLVGYRLTFQPTSEELVSHFLKKKSRDPAFTHPKIRDVNIYKHHPCELPGLASIQSDEQVWYFFCTLDNKYAKSDRASRTAMGGYWKITGAKRDVKAKHSNKPIGFKRTLVFYEGSNTRKENRTNWIVHEYHRNKDPLLKGNVVVCRMERKPNKKHHGSSSAVDEGQPSDNLSYDNTEDDIAEEFEPQPVHPAEWDELIDYNELISSGDSNVWITPLKSEQEDDIAEEFEPTPVHPAEWDELIDYNEWISSGDSNVWITPLKVSRKMTLGIWNGHSLPPDVSSLKKVTEAHIML